MNPYKQLCFVHYSVFFSSIDSLLLFGLCSRAESKYKHTMALGDEVARCEQTAVGPELICLQQTPCGLAAAAEVCVELFFFFLSHSLPLSQTLLTNPICSCSSFCLHLSCLCFLKYKQSESFTPH